MRVLLFAACLLLISCGNNESQYVQGDWIKGTEQEKLDIIENQFGGFGTAMAEVNYRFKELYWAGQDENWEYADYQLEHLEEAIEYGFVRRPKREESAEKFITYTIPQMDEAIKSKDIAVFNKGFEQLKRDCKECHTMEKVPFINVSIPEFPYSARLISE